MHLFWFLSYIPHNTHHQHYISEIKKHISEIKHAVKVHKLPIN